MSYTCHVYRVGLDKDTPLPPCTIQHRTVEAAMSCRTRVKGEAACHRWEIRGGDIVVARGAGRVKNEFSGKMDGVEWLFTQNYLTRQTRIQVFAEGEEVMDFFCDSGRRSVDYARGMAAMLAAILRTRDTGWILDLMECRPDEKAQQSERNPVQGQLGEQSDELPPNVIIGPWRHPNAT